MRAKKTRFRLLNFYEDWAEIKFCPKSRGMLFPEEQLLHAFVQKERQQRHQHALEQVERHDREQHQRGEIRDGPVDLRAHRDDGLERHPVHDREAGNEEPGVEEAPEHRHHRRAHRERDDRALLAQRLLIHDRRRQHERAAYQEVGQIPHERGRRALEQQLDEHLQKLAHHARHRPEVKRADQHRQLTEIQLVE